MTGVRDIDANGFDPYANKPKSWKRKPDGGLPQPTGTWHINAAGSSFDLQIASVDFQGSGLLLGNGAVSGHLLGDEMRGLWDADSRKITFVRLTNDPLTAQIFTGYFWPEDFASFSNHLAGSFEALQGTAASAERSILGWMAARPFFTPE